MENTGEGGRDNKVRGPPTSLISQTPQYLCVYFRASSSDSSVDERNSAADKNLAV
jgi:hypothetical protein